MRSILMRVMPLMIVITAFDPEAARSQTKAVSWLDEPKPAAWNRPGESIPAAPRAEDVDPRCRTSARPAESEQDKLVRDKGWDLIGTYQGGWRVLIIQGTANYDGMCRPWQYQAFVFVRGTFAGTLSPQPMDSRTDGALSRFTLQNSNRLTAQFLRYAAKDPLCCASKTTSVEFDIDPNVPVVRAVSIYTSPNR